MSGTLAEVRLERDLHAIVSDLTDETQAIRRTHNGESVSYLFTNVPV